MAHRTVPKRCSQWVEEEQGQTPLYSCVSRSPGPIRSLPGAPSAPGPLPGAPSAPGGVLGEPAGAPPGYTECPGRCPGRAGGCPSRVHRVPREVTWRAGGCLSRVHRVPPGGDPVSRITDSSPRPHLRARSYRLRGTRGGRVRGRQDRRWGLRPFLIASLSADDGCGSPSRGSSERFVRVVPNPSRSSRLQPRPQAPTLVGGHSPGAPAGEHHGSNVLST